MSTATPIQTLVDTTQDPGLQYLSPRPVNNVLQSTVLTDAGNVTTRFVPVSQQVVNLFNNNTTVNVTNDAAGDTGEIQFSAGGHFSSDADLSYNAQTDTLSIKNLIISGTITFSDLTTISTAPTGSGGSSFSGSYNDLTNKPSIPTNLSQLTNDIGFITAWGQADWNEPANESPTYIQNKPTIPTDISELTDNNSLLGQGGASTGNLTIYDTAINSDTDVIIRTGQYASPSPGFFKFASDGTLELPFGIKHVTAGTVTCNANADTVIYTGTSESQHSFKLLLKVEGIEDGQTDWDTQTCEMTIAKSFRNNNVVGSVYGLVYTSTNPLATFTTRWNSSTSRVEVLCRPTSLLHGVEVVSSITEITTSA